MESTQNTLVGSKVLLTDYFTNETSEGVIDMQQLSKSGGLYFWVGAQCFEEENGEIVSYSPNHKVTATII